jgi:hypothetical protein
MKNLLLLTIFLCANLIFSQTSTPPAVGDGSVGTPYQIASIDNLYWLSQTSSVWAKYFVQTQDIDAIGDSLWDSGKGFTTIGNATTYFTGNYNGQGHFVSHLFIIRASTDYIGLFGITSNSNISNLGVINVNVTGLHETGGLIGYNMGNVTSCYSTGSVAGNQYTGGLMGLNSRNVNTSYSTCNVSGTASTYGGFCGFNGGTVLNCYSTGNINSISYDAAGFISWNYNGTTRNCYSTGIVSVTNNGFIGYSPIGVVSANFFDQTTSLQTSGYGATAKTTAEMKTTSTFTAAGWDYNIWNIDPAVNNGYPYLKWQNPSGTPLPVELFSFTANVSDSRSVKLNWETKTEINTTKFIIERKSNLTSWVAVASVNASGETNSPKQYSFITKNLQADNYQFRLKMIDNDGSFKYSKTIETIIASPDNFELSRNYPNPFNPSTKINYTLPVDSKVTLEVFNIVGVKVGQLVNAFQPAGYYSVDFNSASVKTSVSTGVYFYRITASDIVNKTIFSAVKKMILIK